MDVASDESAKFRDIARATADWQWEVDAELRIVDISGQATAVFGQPRGLLIGRALTSLGRLSGGHEPPLTRALRERRPFHGQLLEIASGFIYRLDGTPIFDREGKFRGFRGLATMADGEASPAEQLVRSVNGELVDMLRGIVGHAEAMTLQNGDYGDYARDIATASHHLMALLAEDASAASRPDRGSLDVHAIVEEARAMVVLRAAEKRITLQLPPAVKAFARADRRRVLQILLNLLTNAVKFTPSGGHVGVDIETRDESVGIRVHDTGHGIAPIDHELVFAQFTRLSPSHEGSGLGLHISRRLAREMGGDLRLESSARGEGARFMLTLPAA